MIRPGLLLKIGAGALLLGSWMARAKDAWPTPHKRIFEVPFSSQSFRRPNFLATTQALS